MKTLINGERKVVEQAGMSQYLFSLNFDIPQVGLNCFAKLKFEDEAFINNLYEELLNVAELRMSDTKMLYEKDGNQIAFNKYTMSTLIMDYITQAMQNLTDSGKSLMTVYIDEEKETLKKYRDKQKVELDTLKEHIRNNNLEIQKQSSISVKNEPEMAGNSNENISTPRGEDQVAQSTTEEINMTNGRKNMGILKPKTTNLSGMLTKGRN